MIDNNNNFACPKLFCVCSIFEIWHSQILYRKNIFWILRNFPSVFVCVCLSERSGNDCCHNFGIFYAITRISLTHSIYFNTVFVVELYSPITSTTSSTMKHKNFTIMNNINSISFLAFCLILPIWAFQHWALSFACKGKLSDTIMGNPVANLWTLDKQHLFKYLTIQQGYTQAVWEAIKGLVHYFVSDRELLDLLLLW